MWKLLVKWFNGKIDPKINYNIRIRDDKVDEFYRMRPYINCRNREYHRDQTRGFK